jgi:hypothetical protein
MGFDFQKGNLERKLVSQTPEIVKSSKDAEKGQHSFIVKRSDEKEYSVVCSLQRMITVFFFSFR